MQDLNYPWRVGGVYHFQHAAGRWKGDLVILGYGAGPQEVEPGIFQAGEEYNWVEVEFMGSPPGLELEPIDKLNADADWIWEELNITLENE